MRQIVLDTETTGLSPESGDRVVEIGCVELLNRRPSGRNLHFYINPQRPNSEDALKVHGLTDEFLADKPIFAAVVDEFLDYIAGAEVIIHNAAFDVGFLDEELKRAGRPAFCSHVDRVTDSLAMARDLYPGKSNSLDALCRRLEVDNSNRALHGALLDAGLLADVFICMTRGQNSLVIEAVEAIAADDTVAVIDFSRFELPILAANEDELAAHERVLAEMDKASGGRTTWRLLVA